MMTKSLKKWMTGFLAVTAVVSLSACEDARKSLISSKSAPDEFAVYSRAPLTLPPSFGLRPPTPGAERPDNHNPTGQAYQAMTGKALPQQQAATGQAFVGSPGEMALLQQTHALNTDPDIRDIVNRESSVLAEESQSVTEKLLFSQDTAAYGSTVDPAKETQRLKENQALGKPLSEGEVPTIRRQKKGLLEGLWK